MRLLSDLRGEQIWPKSCFCQEFPSDIVGHERAQENNSQIAEVRRPSTKFDEDLSPFELVALVRAFLMPKKSSGIMDEVSDV